MNKRKLPAVSYKDSMEVKRRADKEWRSIRSRRMIESQFMDKAYAVWATCTIVQEDCHSCEPCPFYQKSNCILSGSKPADWKMPEQYVRRFEQATKLYEVSKAKRGTSNE